MLEILQFVFSSFWIWLGTAILTWIISGGVSRALVLVLGAIARVTAK